MLSICFAACWSPFVRDMSARKECIWHSPSQHRMMPTRDFVAALPGYSKMAFRFSTPHSFDSATTASECAATAFTDSLLGSSSAMSTRAFTICGPLLAASFHHSLEAAAPTSPPAASMSGCRRCTTPALTICLAASLPLLEMFISACNTATLFSRVSCLRSRERISTPAPSPRICCLMASASEMTPRVVIARWRMGSGKLKSIILSRWGIATNNPFLTRESNADRHATRTSFGP
mmetsp:Transcript_34429/g.97555  ORF Transcript_34429/g.97555 Transcript_34429/m.97555 type:complete len:234 (-) Transcript_34429:2263-2964(-)